jgi:very-short-patch-repair endonuclease
MSNMELPLPNFRFHPPQIRRSPVAFGEGRGGAKGGELPRAERSNPGTRHQAIKLRKESTPAERKLWSRLRNDQLGVAFRRQHAIGNYIPDFCSPKAKLVIELDGSQHLEQQEYDLERTQYLESQGYKVLRFWNNQVMNDMDGVIRAIVHAMEAESKHET